MAKHLLITANADAADLSLIQVGERHWLDWTGSVARVHHADDENQNYRIDFLGNLEADNFINRTTYLQWIYKFGMSQTRNGQSVACALHISQRMASFWWLSLLAEKSPFKSSAIFETFKLMTLERLVQAQQFQSLTLVSRNRVLGKTLRLFCVALDLPYAWHKQGAPVSSTFKERMPNLMRAAAWFSALVWKSVSAAWRSKLKAPKKNTYKATIFTYFPNFDTAQAEQGLFKSAYWGPLHEWLDNQKKVTINWVLLYQNSPKMSYFQACTYKQRLQRYGKDNYFLLEEFLKPRDVFIILGYYMKLAWKGWNLTHKPGVQDAWRIPGTELNVRHVHQHDWADSFWGKTAMENCGRGQMFCRTCEAIGADQQWGVYPFEFQAWEKILAYHWKKYRIQGKLIGYQHSTVRTLLLNYFHAPNTWQDDSASALPRPDFVAVNGPMALNAFRSQGYPAEEIMEVEALRFHYLQEAIHQARAGTVSLAKTLLVACDVSPTNSQQQLRLLAEVLSQSEPDRFGFEHIWIKAHPFCPVDQFLENFSLTRHVELVESSLEDWMHKATHVFTANATSVALEALVFGKQAASCVSLESINLSPLLGLSEGCLVRNMDELRSFLLLPSKTGQTENIYFNLDTPFHDILQIK